MRALAIVGLLGVALTACASEPPAPASIAALGEPMDGFPSWGERVVFVWTNRARADPAADLASCTVCAEAACYSARPPVVWSHALSRAARFHSANLVLGGCGLQHDSPCTVLSTIGSTYTPGACDGAPACACESGTFSCGSAGTGFGTRIGYFGSGASAENIARGRSDPVQTFYQWLHEPETSATCGFRPTNGHRANILGTSRALGVGLSGTTWTQDFSGTGTPSGIVGGVHYPRTGAAIDFRANWYGTAAPRSANVSVEGTCRPMTVERGTGTNGTFLAAGVAVPSGCAHYVFHFVDAAGTDVFYPSTGSFGIGCAADWDATRPATCGACTPSCAGRTCGPDGCGGSCGTCGTGRTCNAGGACVCSSGTDCGGSCVDTVSDEANCGGCGIACGAGSTCTASSCSCVPSCGARSCGADGCGGSCGTCATDRICTAGACACSGSLTDCGGACVDTRSDEAHCGSCGAPCAATETCSAGVCSTGMTCTPDCTGRECGGDGCTGSCGTCGAGEVCTGGVCACDAALTDCSGACVDTRTDPANCGACGTACGVGETCVASACLPPGTDAGPRDAGTPLDAGGLDAAGLDAPPLDGDLGEASGRLYGTCTCRAAGRSPAPRLAVLVLALFGARRRTRRPRA